MEERDAKEREEERGRGHPRREDFSEVVLIEEEMGIEDEVVGKER